MTLARRAPLRSVGGSCAAALLACACGDAPAAPDAALSDGPAALDARADTALPHADAIGMNDVSILWPLMGNGDALPSVATEGPQGALLDEATYALVAPLVRGERPARDTLRVVALRLDPCFPGLEDCTPMIRLVAQPRRVGAPGFDDAAVHLHYEVSLAELDAALETIAGARMGAGLGANGPLGVHPALLAEGPDGSFATALRTSVLAELGMARLTRVTFTTRTAARAATWEWGRIDRVGSGFERGAIPVAGTGASELQTLTGDGFRDYTITPPSPTAGALSLAYVTPDQLTLVPSAKRESVVSRITDVLHPDREHAESLDCASCHVATHLARETRDAWPEVSPTRPAYMSDAPLDTPAPTGRDRIRAFGYFEAEPQINTRVVNETAAVLDALRPRR